MLHQLRRFSWIQSNYRDISVVFYAMGLQHTDS